MPHLIMLDLNLPRLDGLTVLRCVRLKKPSLPMLVARGTQPD
jgi:DNA-binding response OmpR family regulator